LPHRKIQNVLKRQYGLDISPATILDLTRRAPDAVRSEYEEILDRIHGAEVLYEGETSIRIQGEKYWIWAFTTPTETFVAIRKSRGMKVLMEILTRRFHGNNRMRWLETVCQVHKPYTAMLGASLRESEYLAKKIAEAAPLDKALRRLYRKLNDALETDPPLETRRQLWYIARAALRRWIRREYASEKVKKFIGKIENGFEYWFTFVFVQMWNRPTTEQKGRFVSTLSSGRLSEHCVMRKEHQTALCPHIFSLIM